jgi:hypothetical protein
MLPVSVCIFSSIGAVVSTRRFVLATAAGRIDDLVILSAAKDLAPITRARGFESVG